MTKRNQIIYWIATGWLSLGMLSTGIVQLMKKEVPMLLLVLTVVSLYFRPAKRKVISLDRATTSLIYQH